ncbi:hypothetical protein SDC9_121395 [bioreactor metagenome]|uniref:Uncharacterized protein n=1 Tax=bioreactor metagenome TaxID=1076179 RepID=A0A645CBT5_9ZZZZ
MVVRALIAHNADGAKRREDRKILPDIALQAGVFDFLTQYGVAAADDFEFFLGHFAEYTYGKPEAREWLALHKLFLYVERPTQRAHFIFKEHAQRLKKALERHRIRQPADIVMALDHGRVAGATFDHVRVNCALDEIFNISKLFSFFFKYTYEFGADDFALALGVGHATELFKETLARVDMYDIKPELAVRFKHLLGLILPQQAVVNKHTGEP